MGTKYQGTDEEINALNLFIKIERASNVVSSRINASITNRGLTVSQFGILEALHHLGPLHQNQLGEKLLKTGGNITMVVDNLQKRELVRRVRSEEDRRYIKIHLTEKGKELISEIFPDHVQNIVKEMNVLTQNEQQQLGNLLKKLGKGIEAKKNDEEG